MARRLRGDVTFELRRDHVSWRQAPKLAPAELETEFVGIRRGGFSALKHGERRTGSIATTQRLAANRAVRSQRPAQRASEAWVDAQWT